MFRGKNQEKRGDTTKGITMKNGILWFNINGRPLPSLNDVLLSFPRRHAELNVIPLLNQGSWERTPEDG